MKVVPKTRPQLTRCEAETILEQNKTTAPAIIGIRGYYSKSLGKTPENERGLYDDAIIVITTDRFATFNANTDPAKHRVGIATLKTGAWSYQKHRHKGQYPALGQAAEVVVTRDGAKKDFRGYFGINIHYGGYKSTWSEGCQTIYQPQWTEFINLVYSAMDKLKLSTIPYLLIEQ